MNDEIKKILDNLKYCKEHDEEDNYYPEDIFSKDDPYILLDYITNLQQKVEQYENPDDLTLFYMWLDEKSKDKMKELQKENENFRKLKERYQLEKEYYKSRIDEAIKYIEHSNYDIIGRVCSFTKLLDILQGDSNENN